MYLFSTEWDSFYEWNWLSDQNAKLVPDFQRDFSRIRSFRVKMIIFFFHSAINFMTIPNFYLFRNCSCFLLLVFCLCTIDFHVYSSLKTFSSQFLIRFLGILVNQSVFKLRSLFHHMRCITVLSFVDRVCFN